MTITIKLYVAPLLAADYYRRRKANATSDQILRRFPAGGGQVVTKEVAELMLSDANLAPLTPDHGPAMLRAYAAMARQIERRFEELSSQQTQEASLRSLAILTHFWVRGRG